MEIHGTPPAVQPLLRHRPRIGSRIARLGFWVAPSAAIRYIPPVPMNLLPATQSIIQRVEELTGRPVRIEEDASLQMRAHIQVARGDAPLPLDGRN